MATELDQLLQIMREAQEDGMLTDIISSDKRSNLTMEDVDVVADMRTKELYKEVFSPEREAIKDLYQTVIAETFEEQRLNKLDIEVSDEDIDEIFDILFEG